MLREELKSLRAAQDRHASEVMTIKAISAGGLAAPSGSQLLGFFRTHFEFTGQGVLLRASADSVLDHARSKHSLISRSQC